MKQVTILYREDRDTEDEFQALLRSGLRVSKFRMGIPEQSLVIGRYSVLPFYRELEEELESCGSSVLINSYAQHRYIADITQWYQDVQRFTPATYDTWYNLPEGSYVVKGKTNSRKHQWSTMMFAQTKEDIPRIVSSLLKDSLIQDQGIVVRQFVPLKTLDTAINDLPITREWRCFFLGEHLIASGFYWASHPECYQGELPLEGKAFAKQIAKIIAQKTNFFVLDVAEKAEGGWTLIEINDGQMSGLSCIDPDVFYGNLKIALLGSKMLEQKND